MALFTLRLSLFETFLFETFLFETFLFETFLFETFLSERSSSKSYQELLRESIAKYLSFNPEADIFCNCTLSSLNNLCCRLFDIKLDLQDKKEFDKRSLSVADDVSFYL